MNKQEYEFVLMDRIAKTLQQWKSFYLQKESSVNIYGSLFIKNIEE